MIVTEIIMKLNIVQELYIVFKTKHKFKIKIQVFTGEGVVQSQDTTPNTQCAPDPP